MLQLFLAWLIQQIGCLYVWGAQGQRMTEALIRKMETSATNVDRALKKFREHVSKGLSLIAYDCSGLIVHFICDMHKLIPRDTNANGLMRTYCQTVTKAALVAGDLVFKVYTTAEAAAKAGRKKGDAYHVGIYMDDGTVIHAKGRDHGVVREALSREKWNAFGRLKVFENEAVTGGSEIMLKRGDKGQAVYDFQHACIRAGYSVLETGKRWPDTVTGVNNGADSSYGPFLESVVKSIQGKHKLPQTGVVDAATYGRLVSEIKTADTTAITNELNAANAKIAAAKKALN